MVVAEKLDRTGALIDGLPIAVAVLDCGGRLIHFNQKFQLLWSLEAGWLRKKPKLEAMLDRLRDHRRLPEQKDHDAFRSRLLGLVGNLVKPLSEDWFLPDGRSVKVVFSPFPLEGPKDGMMATFEDLTDRLSLERAFNEILTVHKATLDNLTEGLAVFGSDGMLELHNPAFASFWHLPEDALGESFHISAFLDATRALLPVGEDWPVARARLSGRLLGRKSGSGSLHLNDDRILEATNIPLPNGAALLHYADITDSVKLQEAFSDRADAMAAANRLKSEFLANLSHQIRTPLTTIEGFAELLSGDYFGKLNKRQQEYADGIVDATRSVTGLVGDIMDLADIEAGLLDLQPEPVDIHACLSQMLGLVRERARHKKLKLAFECATDIGWIIGDERRLKQCLLHLLSNAILFSGQGGEIKLSANRGGDAVTIDVIDTGVGIPTVDIERIFRGFERGDHADEHGPGAGLGLTLVKSFIELHGGHISIKSKPNQGTHVMLILPVDGAAEEEILGGGA